MISLAPGWSSRLYSMNLLVKEGNRCRLVVYRAGSPKVPHECDSYYHWFQNAPAALRRTTECPMRGSTSDDGAKPTKLVAPLVRRSQENNLARRVACPTRQATQ